MQLLTATDVVARLGKVVTVTLHPRARTNYGMAVDMVIKGHRVAWGKDHFELTPYHGNGSAWFHSATIDWKTLREGWNEGKDNVAS